MEFLLSKLGRQISFPISPIVRQTIVDPLGFNESEINIILNAYLNIFQYDQ